jgi:hypothetical protein
LSTRTGGPVWVLLKNYINIACSPIRLSIRMMERVAGRSDRMSERTTERNLRAGQQLNFNRDTLSHPAIDPTYLRTPTSVAIARSASIDSS